MNKYKLGVYDDLTDLEALEATSRLQVLYKSLELQRMRLHENQALITTMEALALLIRVTPKVHNGP